MATLANRLRELAAEFQDDRDYRTEGARFAFRNQLITTMCNAAWALDKYEQQGQVPLPADELDGLGFDTRTLNTLRNERIVTLAQVARVEDAYLMRIPNFGRKSLKRLRAKVPYVPEGRPRVRVQAVAGHA